MIPLSEIVASGLCIGCGLCESIAPDSIDLGLSEEGVERPLERTPIPSHQLAMINAVCPGLRVDLEHREAPVDTMWGPVLRLAKVHAADPEIRFRSASGGALTALGVHLLQTREVERVLHVAPSRDQPLQWQAQVSTSPRQVIDGSGSRYGPVAALKPVMELIDDAEPLALIAKPCDAAAVRNLIKETPNAAHVFRYLLVMACGGASKLTKHWDLIRDFQIDATEVTSLRHRGYGNPGPTRVTTASGRSEQTPYLEMWEEEGQWELQWRCKVCPDGMGEVADVVALDCWPGGLPEGEDPGFNGVIARTTKGAELVESALHRGALVLDADDLPVASTLEGWQPHQSRRKAAVNARLDAMRDQGLPTLETTGLRLKAAESRLTDQDRRREYEGALARIRSGSV